MATKPKPDSRSDDGVPSVNPQLRRSIDSSYSPDQDGSSPIDTASVKVDEERNVWPMVWVVTAVVMVLITIFLLVG